MNLTAILKFPLAILKMEKFAMANKKIFTRKVEEHILKVSCLYPEVHDRLKKQTFPAPLVGQEVTFIMHILIQA